VLYYCCDCELISAHDIEGVEKTGPVCITLLNTDRFSDFFHVRLKAVNFSNKSLLTVSA